MSKKKENNSYPEIPLTNEEGCAFAALRTIPMSSYRVYELCCFMIDEKLGINGDDRSHTMMLVKLLKIPKAKMIRWLDDHNIKNDRDLVGMVLKPRYERYLKHKEQRKNEEMQEAAPR